MNPHGYTDLSGFLVGMTTTTLEWLDSEFYHELYDLEEKEFNGIALSYQEATLITRIRLTRELIQSILSYRFQMQALTRVRGRV